MRALLLAAGLGTRLRPQTLSIPKCLVVIRGRPLLDYWADHLFAAGIERVLVNTHWLAGQVRAYVARSPYRDRIDLVHEPELLGTGGTVRANREWFGDGPFMVCHADNLTDFEVTGMIAAHSRRASSCCMTMLAFRTDSPRSCGILETDVRGVVTAFHEKVEDPPGDLANAAVYIFEPEIAAALGPADTDLSTQVLPRYIGRIQSFKTKQYHRDIGSIEALRRAELDYPGRPAADAALRANGIAASRIRI